MEIAKKKLVLSALALLSGIFYLGIPGILLLSDYKQGGVTQVLEAIRASEYDEIKLWAFYAPIAAFILFIVFAISILTKSKASIVIGLTCAVFSAWSLTQIDTIGLLGLVVSAMYLFSMYRESNGSRT
jgi:hypothetical protein